MRIIYKNECFDSEELDRWVDNTINLNSVRSIAVIMNRSPQLIWLLYRAYCQGVTFIPIDPKEHREKINHILNQTQPDTIICDNNKYEYEQNKSYDYNNVAYVLFTSGTTGGPKGVLVKKNSIENFILGLSELIDFSEFKKIISLTSISFDIFFIESIMAILKNMTIVLSDEDEQANPRAINRLLMENNVDIVQLTPSRLQMLLNYDPELSGLKTVTDILIGGEALSINLLYVLQKKTNARIFHMYGPTETTIWSTVSDLTNSNTVNIGHPIKNTEIYIVDENLTILPNGKKGEICIAGAGLALGYINNNELTSKKFVFLPQNGTRVYKTGDLGRRQNDGTLEWCGRIDNQIKLRGHRVELEEIESVINQFEGIHQSLVGMHNRGDYVQELYAFFSSSESIDADKIKKHLRRYFPEYMIPNKIQRVDSFVQNINGKIDRQYYSNMFDATNKPRYADPILSNKVIQIIQENSNTNDVDIDINVSFVDIGYDSLSFIKAIVALEREFKIEFDDSFLLLSNYQTVGDLVTYVNKITDLNK